MALRIGDTYIASNTVEESAELYANGQWKLSWVPGRLYTRSQAVGAVLAKELLAQSEMALELSKSLFLNVGTLEAIGALEMIEMEEEEK